jgi:peroxiredoxin
LQDALPEFKALDATLVAISPDNPDESLSTAEKNAIEFVVLSDIDLEVARQFGIVFELPKELDATYQSFGIDLRKRHNTEKAELPIPATYVVAKDGTVTYAHLDVDYTYRADLEEIVEALGNME